MENSLVKQLSLLIAEHDVLNEQAIYLLELVQTFTEMFKNGDLTIKNKTKQEYKSVISFLGIGGE